MNKEELNELEKIHLRQEKNLSQGMLANEKFVSKAPEKLIEAEKEKVKKYTEIIEKLKESLN